MSNTEFNVGDVSSVLISVREVVGERITVGGEIFEKWVLPGHLIS